LLNDRASDVNDAETCAPAPSGLPGQGSPREVLRVFLGLGLTSFGGPVAHLGFFRQVFVERRGWIDDTRFAQLLALCQFLPGPASSQLGFALGLLRAGWLGGLAAFIGFTLPSAVMMFVVALLLPYAVGATAAATVHGLELVALSVVAAALLGMARQLCPEPRRATLAVAAFVLVLSSASPWAQLLAIAAGALAGALVLRDAPAPPPSGSGVRYGARTGAALLGLFALLLGVVLLAGQHVTGLAAIADPFYRAGALVFGGGHVVLPLLEASLVAPAGAISQEEFLAGYGAAQALPGPMFAFSAFLGARLAQDSAVLAGAVTALMAMFLPGLLLVAGALPLWSRVVRKPAAAGAVAGVNAAVVGVLGAALHDPVWITAVRTPADLAIAAVGFTLLVAWRVSALLVVVWSLVASACLALSGLDISPGRP
jgi:chromate transporter